MMDIPSPIRLGIFAKRMGACFLFAACVMAAAPLPWGDNLSGWVGRYPTDQSTKPPRRLLRVPAVARELRNILPLAELNRLLSYRVEHPVDRLDHFLLITQCMPHDCGDNNAMVVLDEHRRQMWVGFFSRSPQGASTRWFGPSDHRNPPDAVIRRFDASNTP